MCKSFQIMIGLIVCLSVPTYAVTFANGDGSAENPYQIESASGWQLLMGNSVYWSSHFILTDDFSLLAVTVTPVGSEAAPFTGSLDGNGHSITSISINTSGTGVGLFGYTGSSAVIQNLNVASIHISATGVAGGLAGTNYGTVRFCRVNGSVSGNYDCGGLAGRNFGSIRSCYVDMIVSVTNYTAGGLVGYNPGQIRNCSATGAVSGDRSIGGLVGFHDGTALEYCYATGQVSGNTDVGGLVGFLYTSITACFWDTQTSGTTDGVGNRIPDPAGAAGKTTVDMQSISTFLNAGWDFSAIDGDFPDWWMPSNEYPRVCMKPWGGEGIEDYPWQIWTAEQMNAIGLHPQDWASCFILLDDIDMSAYTGTQYNIIGSIETPFTGAFDGNGHFIRNLSYTTTEYIVSAGLFGYISAGTVHDLGLLNVSILADGQYIGGLAGINYFGALDSCYVTGTVSGTLSVGGLVGGSIGTINSCFVIGPVTGSEAIGGLCGENYGPISNCYAICSISCDGVAGGLAGANSGEISACYAVGSVVGSEYIGGFCGLQYDEGSTVIENCFWDVQVSGQKIGCNQDADHPGTITNLTGKKTAQMKTLSTFTAAGWDFSATDGDAADWQMFANDYPRMPYETGAMTVKKCTAAAGKTLGSISFTGTANAAASHLQTAADDGANLEVQIHSPFMTASQLFTYPLNAKTLKNGRFAAKDANSSLRYDTKTGQMTFAAKNIDLTGLCCPVTVELFAGDYFASFVMNEAVVNGAKPCPIQFMKGVQSLFTVSKFRNTNGKKEGTDSFTVQGTFTLGSDYDKNANPLYITLGSQTFRVEGGSFNYNSKTGIESCTKAASDDDGIVDAKFDLAKCTYSISVKNAEITESGQVFFGIEFFGVVFNEINIVTLK